MPNRSSRNLLAAVMIIIGGVMVFNAPLSAADVGADCTNVVVNFDDTDPVPLYSSNTSVGPVPIVLDAGSYDIVMTSSDPTHGSGQFLDQLHESWYFTLDNGYVSPTTPDFGDEANGVAIVAASVTLDSASTVTAFWAGQLPSFDSVHATVSFTCVRQTIATTTTTVATTSTTAAATTTAPPTTATATPTTVAGTNATTTVQFAPTTIAAATTTTGSVGEIGGTTEENTELAATGLSLNLAIGGFLLIVAGFGLVAVGSIHDRRQMAYVGS